MSGDPERLDAGAEDDAVLRQYEAYPYPERDPREEAKRLIVGSPSHLAEVNHYLFAGRRDFNQPFRALVAGGGTGDGTIMLAQQLAQRGAAHAEVVYLDISEAARQIAEARAKARSLKNITFLTGTLFDLAELAPGPFDYIDCCGVLHHLADPVLGLQTLARALAPEGGIGLMVYGRIGRRGVYETQGVLRALCGEEPLAAQVQTARRLLDALPPSNWLKRNPFIGDHRRGDAELVDLLLHPRDCAFLVHDLKLLLDAAGLTLTSFVGAARYKPETYIKDAQINKRLSALEFWKQAEIAEALAGNMKVHILYAAKGGAEGRVAQPAADMRPILPRIAADKLAASLGRERVLNYNFGGLPLKAPLPSLAPAIIAEIDCKRRLSEIHAALASKRPDLSWEDFLADFESLYAALNGANHLLLEGTPMTQDGSST